MISCLSPPEQKERTEALVIQPLSQLLIMFAGPHKLIQKRFDKLLDYDNCKERADRLKDRRVKDELQVTRNNYEALNAQLLDELKTFNSVAEGLFKDCVKAFAQVQKDFMKTTLGELKPLLQVGIVSSFFCCSASHSSHSTGHLETLIITVHSLHINVYRFCFCIPFSLVF